MKAIRISARHWNRAGLFGVWVTTTVVVFALALLAFVIPIFGQPMEPKARVVIPFEFAAGDTVLPAGRYEIWIPGMTTVLLRNMQTFQTAKLRCHLTNENPPAFETTLRFRKDVDRAVLHQVVLSDHKSALDLIHGPEVPELVLAKR